MKPRNLCHLFVLPSGAAVTLRTPQPFAVVLLTDDRRPCAVLPCRTARAARERAAAMRGEALQHNPLTDAWEAMLPEETQP
jgi:hypothetical protein